jgi:hypothetical protein
LRNFQVVVVQKLLKVKGKPLLPNLKQLNEACRAVVAVQIPANLQSVQILVVAQLADPAQSLPSDFSPKLSFNDL